MKAITNIVFKKRLLRGMQWAMANILSIDGRGEWGKNFFRLEDVRMFVARTIVSMRIME